jgi:hypothetical protein
MTPMPGPVPVAHFEQALPGMLDDLRRLVEAESPALPDNAATLCALVRFVLAEPEDVGTMPSGTELGVPGAGPG